MRLPILAAVVMLVAAGETKPATDLTKRFIKWQRPALGAEAIGVLLPIRPRWAPALTATSGPLPANQLNSYPVLGPGSWLFFSGGVEARLPQIEPNAFVPFGDAALVRVKATRWSSEFPDPRFVVTGMELLDGTDAYPIRVVNALDDARARFDARIASHDAAVEKALADGLVSAPIRDVGPHRYETKRKAPAPGEQAAFGPATDRLDEGIFPAWFEKENELRVLLVRRVTRAQMRERWFSDERPCPPGAPCMPPRPYWSTQEKGLSMLIGTHVVFDRKGAVLSEEHFGPTPEPR